MKTEAIRQVIVDARMRGELTLPSDAAKELEALEESHAEMVTALKHFVECRNEDRKCSICEATAKRALQKAGAL